MDDIDPLGNATKLNPGPITGAPRMEMDMARKSDSTAAPEPKPVVIRLGEAEARMRGRDELIEMMLRRIRRTQATAKERLEALHDEHRGIEEALIGIFGKVLATAQDQETDAAFGCQVRKLLAERGGIEALTEQCDTVSALHRDNELPLLWPIHVRYRNLLFRLLDLMDIQSATQDRSLLNALAVVSNHRHARRNELAEVVDIGFASQRWQSYVGKRRSRPECGPRGIPPRSIIAVIGVSGSTSAFSAGAMACPEAGPVRGRPGRGPCTSSSSRLTSLLAAAAPIATNRFAAANDHPLAWASRIRRVSSSGTLTPSTRARSTIWRRNFAGKAGILQHLVAGG